MEDYMEPHVRFIILCNSVASTIEDDREKEVIIEPLPFIKVSSFPETKSFTIAAGVSVYENKDYTLSIILSTGGENVIEVKGELNFPDFKREGYSLASLAVQDFEFREPKEYTIEVIIDDQYSAKSKFRVYQEVADNV
jgi:hypothetical protein